jgi:hypothetical protein
VFFGVPPNSQTGIYRMKFTCSCCGQVHEGLADVGFPAPYYYYTVPAEQRDQRCVLTADLCSIDDRDFFIRGCLEIPIIGSDEHFSWGAWSSVSRANFIKYREVFAASGQANVGPFVGWLSVRLPGYPDTLTLKVMAHLRDDRTRPWFELEHSEHPLSVEYRLGITTERLRQIYEATVHTG